MASSTNHGFAEEMHIAITLSPRLIGLQFLAQHLVTFDFPRRVMCLKRTCGGPLLDKGGSTNAVPNIGRDEEPKVASLALPGASS